MTGSCLLVDVDGSFADSWEEKTSDLEVEIGITYASLEGAPELLESGTIVSMVIFCDDSSKSKEVAKVLDIFRSKVGPLAHFQSIVCTEPSPQFMTDVFEYGLENFMSVESWPEELGALLREVDSILKDPDTSESKIIAMSQSIAKGDQGGIAEAEAALGDAHEYDYLAAYSKASALQAIGKFSEAAEVFKNSGKMNKLFRPADSKLGENLMVIGKVDDAIKVFDKLERTNDSDAERKAMLASAFIEKGDYEKADEYMKQARDLNPEHPKIREAQAQLFLSTGKAGKAFKMMDQLEEVGPFLAAKLNEMGIRLSQAGKGKNALALYQKAHKVVRKELKYKVSMNAALACYRLKQFSMALKYLSRTEKEYGRKLEKVEKIRKACKGAIQKQKKGAKAS